MSVSIKITILALFSSLISNSFSQEKNVFRDKSLLIITDTVFLDSLPVVPSSVIVFLNNQPVNDSLYEVTITPSALIWKGKKPVNLHIKYRVFPFDITFQTQHKDTFLIQPLYTYNNPFRINQPTNSEIELLPLNSLHKSGSISRGITVGNKQNLGVSSNFNLQLSGNITPEIGILASITDNNIPIQPDGNTQQLQDFDQVYIQLFKEDNWKLTAGDYFTESNESYFLKFNKKAQGVLFEKQTNFKDSLVLLNAQAGVAISRGKFATNTFNGIEGNQGPYKLTGAENEQLIIVLSGTEQVFIDGKLLKRGADNDYIVDYNTAEITFTPQQLITKNKRIVIQFQYSDKNYVRSLAQTQLNFTKKKWEGSFRFYSEQDHKNQPLQQNIEDPEKQIMFTVGDNIQQALIYRSDSVNFEENEVLYHKKDSLGYSIFVFAQGSDSNLFRTRFSFVGAGKGNYVQDGFSAFGRVYRWVKPDTISGNIIKRGDYEPVTVLITPKKRQLFTFENSWKFSEEMQLNTDLALSNNDINTFSPQGNQNNVGLGGRIGFMGAKKLQQKQNPWKIINETNIEIINSDFQFIERYRPVEFYRNWNLLNKPFNTTQLVGATSIGLTKKEKGKIKYTLNLLEIDKNYKGIKNDFLVDVIHGNNYIIYNGSYLTAKSTQQSTFYRHIGNIEKRFSKIILGYEDQTEKNKFLLQDSLLNNSYQFYEGTFYIKNSDSTKNRYKLYGRYREEKNVQNKQLTKSAYSNDFGLSYTLHSVNKKTRLTGNTAYRKLIIVDTTLGKVPDNTFISQTDFSTSFFKNLIKLNMYYEIGAGLEQKKEFVYIQVNAGQGTYAWIDYNENGIKELNEFEIAVFQDQANYIRVFTQSNKYITAFTNKFSQSVTLNPQQLIGETKNKFLNFIKQISSLTAYKIDRKTTQQKPEENLNPFTNNINDTNLLSINNQIRSSIFYNRTGYKYGASYTYQNTKGKLLLSNGFDSKSTVFHEVGLRYKLQKILFNFDNTIGNKQLKSDYLSNRNYDIAYTKSFFKTTYQKETNQQFNINYAYEEKKNRPESDYARIHTLGAEANYNLVNSINLGVQVNYISIVFRGSENTSIEYEMLQGLKKGDNFTWELLLNKRIAKNLSLTIRYNGRKPQSLKTIHSGTIEMRAFF